MNLAALVRCSHWRVIALIPALVEREKDCMERWDVLPLWRVTAVSLSALLPNGIWWSVKVLEISHG